MHVGTTGHSLLGESTMSNGSPRRAGEWVQVRSKEEILATLDQRAQIDNLPFMAEMFRFCGQRFRVAARAHKTCDPPSGLEGRTMARAVHLQDTRCDGSAHGGCQANCLLFWKDAWLKPIDDAEGRESAPGSAPGGDSHPTATGCTEKDVWDAGRIATPAAAADGAESCVFVCQSTQVPAATERLAPWDLRQYVEDYSSGNVSLSRILGSFVAFVWQQAVDAGLGFGTALRFVYDTFQRARGGSPYPWRVGKVARGTKTPSMALNLQPGELVRVKPYAQILKTLDEQGNNRGMSFDAEMVPYCGGTYRVLRRVSQIINEKTGAMHVLKNDCIMLEGVVCTACYAEHRRNCPRAIPPYWREIWLERVPTETRIMGTLIPRGETAAALFGAGLPSLPAAGSK
jgi:hypothetical protein